eukprot:3402609-Ditylum_brightwellii.AAC.1
MAWMGVAVITIKWLTLCSLLSMSRFPKYSQTELTSQLEEGEMRKFWEKLGIEPDNMQERKVVLIIDEISMTTPIMVLDTRLKQATGLEKNFGGIPVFAFGDFNLD